MSKQVDILISDSPFDLRVALVQQQTLIEYHVQTKFETPLHASLVGNIYKAKISRQQPALDAAFVDFGCHQHGLLSARDYHHRTAFSSHVRQGQSLLVQVNKDPLDNKGARLTSDIRLVGHSVIYLPMQSAVWFSQRAANRPQAESVLAVIKSHWRDSDFGGGFIVRSQALVAEPVLIKAEMTRLVERWRGIKSAAQKTTKPGLLCADAPLQLRVFRDLPADQIGVIRTEGDKVYEQVRDYLALTAPTLVSKLHRHRSSISSKQHAPLFAMDTLVTQIEALNKRRVSLSTGAEIVIDATEALTAIDVNTASQLDTVKPAANYRTLAEKPSSVTNPLVKTNLDAATEIARQLRLRNISGLVVIDFIDMSRDRDRRLVRARLEQAFADDRATVRLGHFSEFGLLELTRKRRRASIAASLKSRCDHCDGSSWATDGHALCYQIVHKVFAQRPRSDAYTIKVSAELEPLLTGRYAPLMRALTTALQRPVKLVCEPSYRPQDYDIVLA